MAYVQIWAFWAPALPAERVSSRHMSPDVATTDSRRTQLLAKYNLAKGSLIL